MVFSKNDGRKKAGHGFSRGPPGKLAAKDQDAAISIV